MLKNQYYYQKQRHTILISFILCLSFMIFFGFFLSPLTFDNNPVLVTLQVSLISAILITLILFIKKNKQILITIFSVILTFYLYMKFWAHPNTAIMLSMLSISPIVPILLFDKKGFCITLTLNCILGPVFIYAIKITSLKDIYTYVALDPFGNLINFIVVQIILLFVFFSNYNKIEMLRAYHKELQEVKQLNSIGQLAASIAHEIRNPLTVINGFAQLLEQDRNLGKKEKEYVQSILKELDYTQVIINDYLSLAKPQSAQIQTIELNNEIRKVADLLMSFAQQQNIRIHLELLDNLIVRIDPIELKQVLVNLIKNAIEAMKSNGTVEIEVRQFENLAQITITDQGIGMTDEQMKFLGTPFYSLKDSGTGIGLTVCYTIIRKYKGDIKVKSKLGTGTTFIIYLPIYKETISTTA